jgi:NADH:ubiquinone oxidoreductase subunit 4 (subunit M)
MECGLGAFALAIFHLIAHGIFKGTIFLNCGNVIHAARQEPRLPPRQEAADGSAFSSLTWITGFVTTLILPLVILLAGHGVLQIPLRDSQGAVIFLFFGWVTSSQAILTLYRLRAVASWKVAAAMLCTLFLVVVTYLFAAERFTYFLFPGAGEAARHFQAGALPGAVFDILVAAAALLIVLSWALIYAGAHGRSIRLPLWIHALRVRFYLLLLNRLYLDALALALGARLRRAAEILHTSSFFPYAMAAVALVAAWLMAGWPPDLSVVQVVRLVVAAALLPLFPFHGFYIAALARGRALAAAAFAILLPVAGLLGIVDVLRDMPDALLSAIRALALFGALYATVKAFAQSRVMSLLAYASLSFYSLLWWHLAGARDLSPQVASYFSAAAVCTSALLLAWSRLQARYGERALEGINGLARPMPRFALLVALLVMAAVGLPPFGLFSGYAGMLLHVPGGPSWDLALIMLAWLAPSFYLFRMMQRLLFGPHRADLPYEDLRAAEAAPLLLMLAILVVVGLLPYEFSAADSLDKALRETMEMTPWRIR